jgi:hypothetical protein
MSQIIVVYYYIVEFTRRRTEKCGEKSVNNIGSSGQLPDDAKRCAGKF